MTMKRSSISILLLLIAVACIWNSGSVNDMLLQSRAKHDLCAVAPLENAPPLMVFTTVAMGGLSGLVADIMWLRASQLSEEGRYFEVVQLADWITKLEPRYTEIWAFHAWNMVFDITADLPYPEDRWRWILNGLSLLREEGMKYNSGDPELYWNIGWIFQNKIAGSTDDAHIYYKLRLAEDMDKLLGGGFPDIVALASDPAKLRKMKEEYNLQPEIMQEVDLLYGPLDWRLAETHALYWAHRGLKKGGSQGNVACERMLYQSVAAQFINGRLIFRTSHESFLTAPRLDMLDKAIAVYRQAMNRYSQLASVHIAYKYFLSDAVQTLYDMNEMALAQSTFRIMLHDFPSLTLTDLESFIRYVRDNPTADLPSEEPHE